MNKVFILILFCLFASSCEKKPINHIIIDRTTSKDGQKRRNTVSLNQRGLIKDNRANKKDVNIEEKMDVANDVQLIKPKNDDNIKTTTSVQPRKWRNDFPDGGYIEFYQDENGRISSKSVNPCIYCRGMKLCSLCMGAGTRYYAGVYSVCPGCFGKRECIHCKGEGFTTMVSGSDGLGNQIMISSDGTTGYGNEGGTTIISRNGTKVYPSRGSLGEKINESQQVDKSLDYIEVIEWAPNYTGKYVKEWCEKCKEVLPLHSHIKKRVY